MEDMAVIETWALILYQVMTIMNFLQSDNLGAAKDSLALLATCLDQAVLDGGRFDLAALLTLQEDPPSAIFINRQQSSLSRAMQGIFSTGRSKVGDCCSGFCQGVGCDCDKAPRAFLRQFSCWPKGARELRPASKGKSSAKEKAKGAGKGWILRSRTDFSWHLRRSFFCSMRQFSTLCTTALPLPLPESSSWCWGSFAGLSKRRLSKLCRARLLHVLVFTLNYVHLGRFSTVDELSRRPSAAQSKIFQRLRSLVAVCGSSSDLFPLAPGRSGPELSACLLQLENFLDVSPDFQGNYLDGPMDFRADPALFPAEELPRLQPYQSLNASRLKLVGTGEWLMSEFLKGPLWLPFQEPAILKHGLPIDESCAPNFPRESRKECLGLMRVWDAKGLLKLYEEPTEPEIFCRVFSAFKSPEVDRQIGDRRKVNMSEFSFDGPSKYLPPGSLLSQLWVRRFRDQLCASITDRRDFYHQARVSPERARTNLLPFSYEPCELQELSAWSEFCAEKRLAVRADREETT
eukprot:s4_g45.t1